MGGDSAALVSHTPSAGDLWTEEIKAFLSDREAELIVLVEGTDEMTGSAVQATHSYRWDDIVYNATFAPCIFPRRVSEQGLNEEGDNTATEEPTDPLRVPLLPVDEELGMESRTRERQQSRRTTGTSTATACFIDFSKFHDTVPVPTDAHHCPYVPDWA